MSRLPPIAGRLRLIILAEKTGVRPPTISAICTGTAKHLPIDVLDKICEVLECQPGDFLEHKK